MTAAPTSAIGSAVPDTATRDARQWRRLARVVWLQHRGAFIGMFALYVACAATILVGEGSARSMFARYVADHCVTGAIRPACPTISNNFASMKDPISAVLFVLEILPVIVGVFLGAPIVAREIESGTYRFTFSQATSRTRYLVAAIAMLGAFVAVGGVVLGFLIAGWAHPFEVAGVGESMWEPGNFVTSWWMLAAWSLLGVAVGALIGTVVKRVVPAMATTLVLVGGLVVATTAVGVRQLISIAPLVGNSITPRGLGVGTIALPASRGDGPRGAWLLRAWMTGSHGVVLSPSQSSRVMALVSASKGSSGDALHLLALHDVSYWVSYQPASRFALFQGVAGAFLVLLAAIATVITARRLRHLA
ncbi:MAG: hypothetical protein ACYCSX_10820 [Acidimicrobiales bacterium]